jgi:prepilin-type N-terminal cleavage/methylation domain-containing protein
MCSAPGNDQQAFRRCAFTLLEIMLAVAILGMMALAIYRFVNTSLTAIRVSSEATANDALYSGLETLLTNEWSALPSGRGALLGEPFKLEDRPRDEITWVATAGPGLLTRYAVGEYRVTLRIRPAQDESNRMEIGVLRRRAGSEVEAAGEESWVTLLRDVQSLQIRYFDPRLNTWVDRWSDAVTLPRLVRVVIGRSDNPVPWEAVIALARTPL